jgi:3-keto-5-aminohexanoate cleavage enzyme
VLAARPDAVLSCTVLGRGDVATRYGHFRALADAGMRMGVLDPGSVNLGGLEADARPRDRAVVYANSLKDIDQIVDLLAEQRLGPSMAIYEPGFLRVARAYEQAGRMPAGALVKFYFSGDYDFLEARKGPVGWGLPPTATALAAYLEMMQGSSMPWAAAVLGGCVARTGMARLAIEAGGHVRLGLEDYAGPDAPSNVALIEEVVAIAKACGRPIATPAEAAEILRLPR